MERKLVGNVVDQTFAFSVILDARDKRQLKQVVHCFLWNHQRWVNLKTTIGLLDRTTGLIQNCVVYFFSFGQNVSFYSTTTPVTNVILLPCVVQKSYIASAVNVNLTK